MELGKNSVNKNEDLELLAALMEGRLSGEERARALKLLAESDDALEVFASAVRDLPEEPKVIPIPQARWWRQWKVALPVAAAAVLAVALPRLVTLGGSADFATQFATDLTAAPRASVGVNGVARVELNPGWDGRGWTTRGIGRREPGTLATDSATNAKLAFRLGVRTVDLQVALQRGETAAARRVTDEIYDILDGISMAQGVALDYDTIRQRLAKDPLAQSIERASSAEHDLSELLHLHKSTFVVAQWLGAADLAAQTHYVAFFESKSGLAFVRSAVSRASLARDETEALQKIDAQMKQGLDDRALNEMHEDLRKFIKSRGA